MIGTDIAIDLGTSRFKVYLDGKGIVVSEPSIIAVDNLTDEVIAIGDKAEKIADGAAQSGGSVTHFATKEEAVHELTDQLGTDTAMLVKASHAMHFGWIVEQLKQAYD